MGNYYRDSTSPTLQAKLLVVPALLGGGIIGYFAADYRNVLSDSTPMPLSSNASSCDIKGNISASGERIYHLPGQEYYSRTRVDIGRGERWFCSEEEARSAGWRRSKV